jgi:thiol-disulfide isomerase/thioredoxin
MMIRSVLFASLLVVAGPAQADPDWNDNNIRWHSYNDGLKVAMAESKPICLVFYANWCPHCVKFSTVFHDAKMISETKKFVMIRIDNDKDGEISARYVPDGKYIPRVFFLSSAGQLDPQIQAPRKEYKYFYDERSPSPATARGSFSSSMDKALKKLR